MSERVMSHVSEPAARRAGPKYGSEAQARTNDGTAAALLGARRRREAHAVHEAVVARVAGDRNALLTHLAAVMESNAPAPGRGCPEGLDGAVDGVAVVGVEDEDLLDGLVGLTAERRGRDEAAVDDTLEARAVGGEDVDAGKAAVFAIEEAAVAKGGAPVEVRVEAIGVAGHVATAVDLGVRAERNDDVDHQRIGGEDRGREEEGRGEDEEKAEGARHGAVPPSAMRGKV
jgi:hypothetical protein